MYNKLVKKFISAIIKTVANFSALVFPFFLILYLLLFLLENIFPGFVSHTMDINLFLIPVMTFGTLAAFSKDVVEKAEEKNKKPGKWDIILIIGFSIISFIILYYKTQELGQTGLIISAISALLIFIMSFVLFLPEDKAKPASNLDTPMHTGFEKTKNTFFSSIYKRLHINIFNKIKSPSKKFNYLMIASLILVLFILTSVFFVYQLNKITINKAINNLISKQELKKVIPTPSPTPELDITQNMDEESLLEFESVWNTPVILLNGGVPEQEIQYVSKLLTVNRLKVIETKKADNNKYKSIIIRFNPDDIFSIKYITSILELKYSNIQLAPLAENKTTIEIIIGKTQ